MLLTRLLSKEPALRPDAAEVRQTLADVARPPQAARPVPGPEGGSALVRVLRGLGGKLRTSRGWQFGTGGVVLAIVAALALFFVSTADQAPEGYTTRNEDARVRASLAVPEAYKRSANEDEVTFTDPGNVVSLKLSRGNKDVKENSLLEANFWKCFYEDGAEEGYDETMLEVESRVTEAKQQGEDAAEVSTTYRPKTDVGDPEAPMKFRHELVYVNDDGVRWRLYMDMPAKGTSREDGEAVYQEAKESLKINDL